MQTSPKNSTRRNLLNLGLAAAVAVFCICALAIVGIALNRNKSAAPAVNTQSPQSATSTDAAVIGATVEFIDVTRTPTPTSTVPPAPMGITRDKPYPIATPADIGGDRWLTVVFVTRALDDLVREGNMFNDTPEPNMEYILVDLRMECKKSSNEKCSFTTFELKTVGSNGQVHDQAFVSGIPNELETNSEVFGGGAVEGSVIFLVSKNDPNLVLFYEPIIFGNPVYLALQ